MALKVHVVITLDGVPYRFQGLKLSEARLIKEVTGWKPDEFARELMAMDPDALTGLMMIVKRRNGEHVRFTDIDADLDTLEVEFRDQTDRLVTFKTDDNGEQLVVDGAPVLLVDGKEPVADPTEPPGAESSNPTTGVVN